MTRLIRLVACAAAAVLAAGTMAQAQAPKPVPAKPKRVVGQPLVVQAQGAPQVYRLGQGGVQQIGRSGIPSVPGYYQLGMPNVQKELELVPEQIEKLKELGKKYYEEARADQNVWKDWQKMTPDERKAKSAEVREKYKKRAEAMKAEVEKILLPHQLDKLKQIDFRRRAPYALQSPSTLKKLGINDQQQEKLKQIREKLVEEYQQMQKKALDDALKVLTPEQKKQLEEQLSTRGY